VDCPAFGPGRTANGFSTKTKSFSGSKNFKEGLSVGLFKRGSLFWAIWVSGGVRYQRSTGTSNRKQAEIIERKFKDEENAKRFALPTEQRDMTLSELMTRFMAEGLAHTYHVNCFNQLLPFFEQTAIGSINKGLVGQFRKQRYENDKVIPATVNRDISVLRRLLNWAVEQGLLAVNPLGRVKMERERRVKRQVLSVAEEQRLLRVCPEHLKTLVTLALDTGMRRGELLQQQWSDVALSSGLLYVTHSKTPEGEARAIPLTSRVLALLEASREKEGLLLQYDGAPLKSVRRCWKTAIKNSGIPALRLHDLRHTFNTRLMEAGVIQDVRMALMGHSTGQSINAIYTHVELPAKRRAIAQLEAWVANQVKDSRAKSKEETNADFQESGTRKRGAGQSRTACEVRPQTVGQTVTCREVRPGGGQASRRNSPD
jgi:integrase